jgi:hypothetical protein
VSAAAVARNAVRADAEAVVATTPLDPAATVDDAREVGEAGSTGR